MNLGFLGLQFSFGLQQGNMAPIYSYLGAKEADLPILLLAGPVTGLLVQPVVGALSDRTDSRWGRRTPYFLTGAALCSVCLLMMPFSSSLIMAASLLWLLDTGNNVTMEPYRAYVSDRLAPGQQAAGFLTQSAFTGLAQMLAFLTPSIFVRLFGVSINDVDAHGLPAMTRIAFLIGAGLSCVTILWSVLRVPELPLDEAARARIRAQSRSVGATVVEIVDAIWRMPEAMRRLALMSLFQWYAMGCYWSYVVFSIGRSVFGAADPHASGFREAVLANGELAAAYNGIAFLAAFALIPISKRFGAARVHSVCLAGAALAMAALPHITDRNLIFAPALGLGLGWASIMGNPYTILAGAIPPHRTGVYMGVFNMMIVIPMMLIAATLPFVYATGLGGDPRNVLTLAAGLMGVAAVCALWTAPRKAAA